MTYLRGHPLDYNRWEQEGAAGWSWRHCLPYFKKMEHSQQIGSPYRGQDGFIFGIRKETLGPLNEAFLRAGGQMGYSFSEDVNGYKQEGFSRFEMNVKDGIRSSASYGYLHSQPDNPNLTIWLDCRVVQINMHGNHRAIGLKVFYAGEIRDVYAKAETLLCSGVFGSAQLLMLSGIGPGTQLRKHNVYCKVNLPGVGENLQDHPECHVQIEIKQPISLNRELQLHRMIVAGGVQWIFFKTGVAAFNQCHVGAFLNSAADTLHPDIEIHFFPVFLDKNWYPVPDIYGFKLSLGPVRPTSRGKVTLIGNNINDPLDIDPNYMATDEDWRVMREAVRLGVEITRQDAFKPYYYREDTPGIPIDDDKELDKFIRSGVASSYHPCGTCKMGADDDPMAVVDSLLRVRQVENLRVVDASVMPSLPSANIHATTIMLAEKSSDHILGREPMGPDLQPFHMPKEPNSHLSEREEINSELLIEALLGK